MFVDRIICWEASHGFHAVLGESFVELIHIAGCAEHSLVILKVAGLNLGRSTSR